MAELFVVLQDGRPIQRGLIRRKAEAYARCLAEGREKRVCGTSRRVPAYEIAPDRQATETDNRIYREYREEGGRIHG